MFKQHLQCIQNLQEKCAGHRPKSVLLHTGGSYEEWQHASNCYGGSEDRRKSNKTGWL